MGMQLNASFAETNRLDSHDSSVPFLRFHSDLRAEKKGRPEGIARQNARSYRAKRYYAITVNIFCNGTFPRAVQ